MAVAATAVGVQADGLRITHWARSLQPGEVVLLKLDSELPLTSAEARFLDRTFPLFEERPDRWFGLVGIDLEAKPGRAALRVVGQGSGATVQNTVTLIVQPKDFPVRRLQVEDRYVSPPPEVQARIEEEARLVASIFARQEPQRWWEGSFLKPVPGPALSSFGKRSVFNGRPRSPHSGTDFKAAAGTPVQAPNGGRVALARELYFAGNTVILDHGGGLYSYFAHLSKFAVAEGQDVRRGEVVGAVGATGRVTGPHLHWTARLCGTRVDPVSLMAALDHLEKLGKETLP
jgi:murein DD-endopeptidase MepM/ murein hydrolase activator NlpD